MKRLAVILALLAVDAIAAPPYSATVPRGCRDRSCVRERVIPTVTPSAPACSLSIQCGITAADKAGNWWALQTDGTMTSGSSLTMNPTGSPGVSPLTFDGATQKYTSSATVAFPATSQSYTVVYVAKFTSVSTAYVVAKWPAATQTFICGVDTNPIFYAFTSAAVFVSATDARTAPTATWLGMACTYNNGTQLGSVRYLGTTTTGAFSGTMQTSTAAFTVAGTGTTFTFNGQLRGAFYTEKVLSDADVDRIIAGAM